MTMQLLGVDLGGTQIRAALADENGAMRTRVATLTLADEGPAAVIETHLQPDRAGNGGAEDYGHWSRRSWPD